MATSGVASTKLSEAMKSRVKHPEQEANMQSEETSNERIGGSFRHFFLSIASNRAISVGGNGP
jgi:hypothetical protein